MKRSLFVKVLSLAVVLAMAFSVLVACGSQAGQQTADDTKQSESPVAAATEGSTPSAPADGPGWKKDTSPVTLNWYVNETWFESPEGNLVHEYIKEKTGVDMQFVIPVGNAGQKLNTMIASNSLPDIVTLGWYEQQVPQLQDEGFVYSLTELADKYDPYFYKVADKGKLDWYKRPDGKVYAYPCASNSPEEVEKFKLVSNRSFLVRKDIYEAIGKPDMRTPDGFINALKAAQEKFPKAKNGQPMIPMGFTPFNSTGNTGVEDILLEFLAVPREINGQYFDVKCANPDPDYQKWLKTFRKAHELGFVTPDIFVDDRNKIEEKIQQGRYFALLYQWKDAMSPLGKLYQETPDQVYISVDGPSNSKLDQPKLGVSGYAGWEISMISKNCKHPERAISFFTYGISEEGQRDFFCGKEGVTYDMVDGKPVIKPEIHTLKNSDMKEFKKKYNSCFEYWFFMTSISSIWEPASPEPFKTYIDFNRGKGWHYGVYDNTRPPADTDEGIILQKAENKWGEILPKLLMAKTDAEFDKIWSDYDAYKKQIGYEKAIAYQRQKVDENKKKVGVK